MKRSKSINLDRMRKSNPSLMIKPLAIAITTSALVACSNNSREANLFRTVDQCKAEFPNSEQECLAAYEKAQAEAYRTGPKYSSITDCEAEFGEYNCSPYRSSSGQNWIVPLMGGFLFAKATESSTGYYSSPMYTSYNRRSPFYGNWTTSDGSIYSRNSRNGKVVVNQETFKSKPTVTKTMSRGGFGSVVSAKSKWGGSSKSSWGSKSGSSSKGGWGG